MIKTRDDRLLWLDLETNSSDEKVHWARILEVGITITDMSGRLISEQNFINALGTTKSMIHNWDEVLLRMHTQNGLLFEVLERVREDIDDQIIDWIEAEKTHPHYYEKTLNVALDARPLEEGELLILAGSGVSHFDRRWVRQFLPRLDARLTHYSIDIGVFRRMLQLHAPQTYQQAIHIGQRNIPAAMVHRALNCNKESIQQYQYYENLLEVIEQHTRDRIRGPQALMVQAGEAGPETATIRRESGSNLCGWVGPGDTCTFKPRHEGKHSWE